MFLSKEDLSDYVEIALSFRTVSSYRSASVPLFSYQIVKKYREFIQHVRNATKSTLLSNGQASMANSIVLVPITANAINELNDILNRLIRMAFAIEAESDYARQVPTLPAPIESKELYRQDADTASLRSTTPQQYASGSNLKRTNVRNQSALVSTANLATAGSSSGHSFKLTPNVIADIFEDFFLETNELL